MIRSDKPLYRFPFADFNLLPALWYNNLDYNMSNKFANVYAVPEGFDEVKFVTSNGAVREVSAFKHKYIPTPEEVMEALRGPQGYTGQMGAKGEPGIPDNCDYWYNKDGN